MPKKRDNPFSDNPFGSKGGYDSVDDPFQDASVPPASSGAWTESRNSAWNSSSEPATIPLTNGAGPSSTDYAKRKEQLDLKEKELQAREAELKKQEQALISSGAIKPKKNWPKCYPIVNHDIKGEVPEQNQRMVTNCYWSYLGLVISLTWNAFAALMALCVINSSDGRLAGFLLAMIYWFAGVPGGWVLWYMRIYNLAIRDRALVYAWFFLMFCVHIAFSIFAAVSPPMPFVSNWSLAGYITCIKGFDKKTFVGVVYVIGGVLWTLESLWSFWAITYVYRRFRSGGGVRRMQSEAAGAAASAAVNSKRPNFGAQEV